MKKIYQVVITAAALVALSGLAYSENTTPSGNADSSNSGTMGNPQDSHSGDATGTTNEMNKDNKAPGTVEGEKSTNPPGSPGGVMGKYSSAKKGGSKMSPDSGMGM